jgi:hypothetical protein
MMTPTWLAALDTAIAAKNVSGVARMLSASHDDVKLVLGIEHDKTGLTVAYINLVKLAMTHLGLSFVDAITLVSYVADTVLIIDPREVPLAAEVRL